MEFLIRLIGIIGGIFATSLMFNSSYESVKEFMCANMCTTSVTSKATRTDQPQTPNPKGLSDNKNPLLEVDNNFSIEFLQK